jgi:hypothetical protein
MSARHSFPEPVPPIQLEFGLIVSSLLLCQAHGLMLRLVIHEALCVKPIEAIFSLGRQFGGIVDFAMMREEQEYLLAANDSGDVPAVTGSGQVSAALSLIEENLAPFFGIPDAVNVDRGSLTMGVKPRFPFIQILCTQSDGENNQDNAQQQKEMIPPHLRLLVCTRIFWTYISAGEELYHSEKLSHV